MVLLDLLRRQNAAEGSRFFELVVAHFDHGIRRDSAADRAFVAERTRRLGLEFYFERGNLGAGVSEAAARDVRYKFLNRLKSSVNASAILTAHHQDDLIETMMINILRGTGPRGLFSLDSRPELVRPLLNYSKQDILDYAKSHGLIWREDRTNKDQKYLRNYIRQNIAVKLDRTGKEKLLKLAEKAKASNLEYEAIIQTMITGEKTLDKKIFARLDNRSSKELLAVFLRQNKIRFDSKSLNRCVIFCKTARPAKKFPLEGSFYISTDEARIYLQNTAE